MQPIGAQECTDRGCYQSPKPALQPAHFCQHLSFTSILSLVESCQADLVHAAQSSRSPSSSNHSALHQGPLKLGSMRRVDLPTVWTGNAAGALCLHPSGHLGTFLRRCPRPPLLPSSHAPSAANDTISHSHWPTTAPANELQAELAAVISRALCTTKLLRLLTEHTVAFNSCPVFWLYLSHHAYPSPGSEPGML